MSENSNSNGHPTVDNNHDSYKRLYHWVYVAGFCILTGVVDFIFLWPENHLSALLVVAAALSLVAIYELTVLGWARPYVATAVIVIFVLAVGTNWAIGPIPTHKTASTTVPRRLSSAQRKEIVERLAQFKGTKIAAGAPFGDDEAKAYRDDFVEALTAAGWAFDGHVGEEEIEPPLVGVHITMNRQEAEAGKIPEAVQALVATLIDIRAITRTTDGKFPLRVDTNWHPDPINRASIDIGSQPK